MPSHTSLTAADNARKLLIDARVVEYRRRVDDRPTDLGLRFELGAALLAQDQPDAAIAELQQAVKDPRRQAESLWTLGRAFRAKGLSELAETQLQKALDVGGGPSGRLGKEVLYDLGSVAEQLGQPDAAIQYYSRILEQDFAFRDASKRVEALKASP